MNLTAAEFNANYPVGTSVRYWPVLPPNPAFPPVETKTRTEAWTLGHGQPVVSIQGKAGGVSIEHIELSSPLMATTIWTLNKNGRKVDADPDSRNAVGNEEATRDPIFLVQKRQVHIDTINGIADSQFHHDGDTLWVDAEMFSAGEVAEAKASDNWRSSDEDFRDDSIGVDDQKLIEKGWAIVTWQTERVFFRRPEAEAYAQSQTHNLGELGKGCRVYCVCAEGRLANILKVVHNKDVEAYLHSSYFHTDYQAYQEANKKLYGAPSA